MDREQFEVDLDAVIAAHGQKVRAGIDAAACGTRYDWINSHKANDAFAEVFGGFVDTVFAPPPLPLVLLVVGLEEQDRGPTRVAPVVWRRWIEVHILSRDVLYTFTANAKFLIAEGAAQEILGPNFQPLRAVHTIRFRGLRYQAEHEGPPELVKMALEACRMIAFRIGEAGLDVTAMMRPWPSDILAFPELVKSWWSKDTAA